MNQSLREPPAECLGSYRPQAQMNVVLRRERLTHGGHHELQRAAEQGWVLAILSAVTMAMQNSFSFLSSFFFFSKWK